MKLLALVAIALLPAVNHIGQQAGRITRIEFRPASVDEGGGVFITLVGAGRCTYTIDFGDGQAERRTADLPDTLRHSYAADGEYVVIASPEAPCEGTARAKLDVRAIRRGVWGLSAEPGLATADGIDVMVRIAGRGACVVALDYGDGVVERVEAELPTSRTHRYAKAGVYELHAVANEPCRGEASLKLEVSR